MSNGSEFSSRYGQSTAAMELGVAAEFTAAWEEPVGDPPRIADYLPDVRALRLSALVELIRIDLRQRWLGAPSSRRSAGRSVQAVAPRRLHEYCAEFPELTPDSIPAGLVYEEFVIRRHSGERVDAAVCLREYPAQAGELRELLNAGLDEQSTRPATLADSVLGGGTTRITDPNAGSRTAAAAQAPVSTLREFDVGHRIDDFELLTELGSGAFARVFLARQLSMQRLVAVKMSADHGVEPQTLAQLDHDYIVRVFDQRLLDDSRYTAGTRRLRLLYMQFLPGGTLLGVLRWARATPPDQRCGRTLLDAVDAAMEKKGEIRATDSSVRAEIAALDWPETVAWLGVRLAEALDYANDTGVLHRDVKPANILLTAEGVPKLADFNISYSRDVSGADPVSYFGGSLSYMSPEQLEACHPDRSRSADDLDTRSDLYALGVVLWELLTGVKPFDDTVIDGDDDARILASMLQCRRTGVGLAALERIPADCPVALRRVLSTCLEPDRDRRWASGSVLAGQLELCLDSGVRDLVDPPERSWKRRLRPWRIPLVALAIVGPTLLASLYSINYDQHLIIGRLPHNSGQAFATASVAINSTLLSIGILILAYICRHVISVSRGLGKGGSYSRDILSRARKDSLLLGERAVAIAFTLWTISGIAAPIALWSTAGSVPPRSLFHLIACHVVCGAIAASYPFFLVTWYMVRCIYPMFLYHGEVGERDAVWLRRLNRHCGPFLMLAAAVPLLAIASITSMPLTDIPSAIVQVRFLCAGSVIASVITYFVFRLLESDLHSLRRVVSPVAETGRSRKSLTEWLRGRSPAG